MTNASRIPLLDGWRAISILLVLAAHLLPLGPAVLQLNHLAGAAGMAIFFTLSGFLIVSFLHQGMPIGEFLLKRTARIVPLAWVTIAILALWTGGSLEQILRNLFFVSNLPPAALLTHGEHLWSLSVEMQFYVFAAMLVLLCGRRGLWLVPIVCLAVTMARIIAEEPISIVTWHRVDEILAGGTLALLYSRGWHRVLRYYPMALAVFLFLLCSHPETEGLQYLRPYAAAMMVGSSLVAAPAMVRLILESAPMVYIASISYALYVIHAVLAGTWLGSGQTIEKYLKRPVLFAATFLLAHLSTRYLEQPILRLARSKR